MRSWFNRHGVIQTSFRTSNTPNTLTAAKGLNGRYLFLIIYIYYIANFPKRDVMIGKITFFSANLSNLQATFVYLPCFR